MEFDEIKNLLRGEVENLSGKTLKDDDEEIFKTGFLDSINVLQVILFMETNFNLSIDPFELTLDTLGTVNRMADYVEKKRSE